MASPILPQSDINKVNKILQGISALQGAPFERRTFFTQAELSTFVSNLDLNGSIGSVLGGALNQMNTHGFLAKKPTHHALGQLFAYVLDTDELGLEDQTCLAELIVKVPLVRDAAYIEMLRNKYQLSVDTGAPHTTPSGDEVIPRPSGREVYMNLRSVLATLYGDEGSIRRVVSDAGLAIGRIDFSGSTINIWHAILTESQNSGQIEDLLQVVIQEYQRSTSLHAAVKAYREQQQQSGAG